MSNDDYQTSNYLVPHDRADSASKVIIITNS